MGGSRGGSTINLIGLISSKAIIIYSTVLILMIRIQPLHAGGLVHMDESWTYKPNDDHCSCQLAPANSWGCCGKVTGLPGDPTQKCGPKNWIHINETTIYTCANTINNQQSPIHFKTVGPNRTHFVKLPERQGRMAFHGKDCEGHLTYREGTWMVKFADKCDFRITVNGSTYKLLQFHFHNAEHSINYVYLPLEVHLVHASVDDPDDLLVLGIFLTEGDRPHPFFSALEAQGSPDLEHPDIITKNKINPYNLLPRQNGYWHYKGSLTSPPCQMKVGKQVQWYIMQTPVGLSIKQLYYFTSYFDDLPVNHHGKISRPAQKLHEETIVCTYEDEMSEDDDGRRTRRRYLR